MQRSNPEASPGLAHGANDPGIDLRHHEPREVPRGLRLGEEKPGLDGPEAEADVGPRAGGIFVSGIGR
jgi:hypothetical protein